MKKIIAILTAGLLVLSCNDTEIKTDFDLPDTVMEDFYSRYSILAEINDAYTDSDNNSIIQFTDKSGLESTAIYIGSQWSITQTEYNVNVFMDQIPQDVAQAYSGLGLENENYSYDSHYVVKVERAGFDTAQYEFCFVAPYEDEEQYIENLVHHIIIDETGEVLTVNHSMFNRSIWWEDIFEPTSDLRTMYPDAELLGSANDAGEMLFFIRDEGIIKEVRFRDRDLDGWKWQETRYELDSDIVLPESIQAAYEEYLLTDPGFIYNRVFLIDKPDGLYYGLMMGTDVHNTMISFIVPVGDSL